VESADSGAVRLRLAAERAQVRHRLQALEAQFRTLVDAGTDTNIDDEHDPEGATIAFERQQVAAFIEQTRSRLADLDSAMQACERDAYGSCERCGQPIAAGRLEARPGVRTCIACASAG
jgi:RNA polymerase-binding transcription factor DksA